MKKIKEIIKKLITTKETYHLVIVLLVIFVAYQAFVVVPQRNEQRKIEAEKAEARANELKYTFCVMRASENYSAYWDNNCKDFGINKKSAGCTLPVYIADDLAEVLKQDKNACLTLYK